MVQPDGMADDLRGKPITAVAGGFGIHHTSLSNPGQLDNTIAIHGLRLVMVIEFRKQVC